MRAFAAALILPLFLLRATAHSAGISFLVPTAPFSMAGDKELGLVVDRYNETRAKGEAEKVTLIRRGEEFSTLREFMARHLAGETPAIAAIEASEIAALGEASKLLLPLPAKLLKRAATWGHAERSIPFQRTLPVLVADEETLFRLPAQLPSTWSELTALAEKLPRASAQNPDGRAIALPLQGPRGLWLFEALSGQPLWKREPGGLRANRGLAGPVGTLRAFFADSRQLALPEQSWEQAVQAFLARKTPLLVTSLDYLPYLASQVSFRWTAGPLPRIDGGPAGLQDGNSLVVTRDDPAVWKFLDYLYSADVAGRWSAASGLLPIAPDALKSEAWKKLAQANSRLPKLVETALKKRDSRQRATDLDVLRARSEWIQALHLLFGDTSRRMPFEDVLTQLDSHLSRSH